MQYYQLNGHGDVVGLSDSQGQQLNAYTYDIWGNPETEEETVPNVFRYSGEYWDSTTDLQYLRARWYDPNAGRFVSKDPYQGSLDNPLSLNRYSYVENNPIIYVDSTGNRKEHGVGSGGAGGGAGAIVPRGSTSPAPRNPITVTKSPSTSSSTFNLNKSMMKNIRNNTVQGLRDEKIMIRATRATQNVKGTGYNGTRNATSDLQEATARVL